MKRINKFRKDHSKAIHVIGYGTLIGTVASLVLAYRRQTHQLGIVRADIEVYKGGGLYAAITQRNGLETLIDVTDVSLDNKLI